jgi:hypothetical protein
MSYLTAERISNFLHVALVAMIAFAGLDVAIHVAGHLI